VVVWRLDLTAPWDVDAALACLTDPERERAQRGVPVVRRRRVIVRWALRNVLAALLDVQPGAVSLHSEAGRPVVGGPFLDVVHTSSSACGDVALIAVSVGAPVGVDVERQLPGTVRDALAEGWLSDREAVRLRHLPDPSSALTRCWVQKEAVLKAEGVGLRRSPATVATSVADSGHIGSWRIRPVPVPESYLAAVAVPSSAAPAPLTVRDLHPGGSPR
jgi:phosphopantetheinyl transferase